jgi:putative ABC transport system substrate-binding protein
MALGFQYIERAAPGLGVTVQSVRVAGSEDFDKAFSAIDERRPEGLIVLYGPMRGTDLPRLTDFITRHRLPAVFDTEQGVRDGGLMTFGPRPGLVHDAGRYIDKILRGTKPADLPVEEPRTHQLIINLKTAKALGLTIPPSLLLRADQLIE